MPSHLHETLLEMFRHRPALAAELVTGVCGTTLPAWRDAGLGSAEIAELRPVEHRADAVVVLRDGASAAVFAVVVEVQLRRDDDKPWIWPHYLAGVRRRLRCPTTLLAVCVDPDVAAWAAEPIDLDGGGSVMRAQVLGPDLIPVLTDPREAARTPELTVLSALTHVRDDGPYAVLDALMTALDDVEVEHAVEYSRLVLAALPALAREHLEELMATETYDYQSEFTRRLEARGEARGRAAGVLRILDRRDVEVSAESRARITDCTDLEQLDVWFDRAFTASHETDLFG